MGCVSSTLLNQDEDFPQIGSTAFNHHFVSLTSTTYGLLSLDPPPPSSSPMTPPTPLPRFSLTPVKSLSVDSPTEVINSWELMAGLDSTPDNITQNKNDASFRFSPQVSLSNSKPSTPKFFHSKLKENSNPNTRVRKPLQFLQDTPKSIGVCNYKIEQFEKVCPRNGENKLVIYTTSLRGIRKTFEECNAVRSLFQGLGFAFCERDISMDRGLRDEVKELLAPLKKDQVLPPCVFIKGRYIGGADEVLKIHEEGGLAQLLQGLPRIEAGAVCDGCGDVRFLPCFRCNGSCKLVKFVKEIDDDKEMDDSENGYCNSSRKTVVMRCPDCNENGLVLCPICS
ncbi:hypothetical protein BVRB_5g104160 [Beta vulgaris subsp. vulgaris]|uniref:uncharacterized protein At3g28850 n=1 Tax=Beta vulgaris subsp. vulgaris TaxID=3555 RepID=UPI00053F537B|nr:uncharacterized protein At3g28850 [Beta vulgaris subsp. vulgaris]KMT12489.1 hypothetical protein BVRB_5g104160 [Beta vulgaris subsp. vulgaris]